jgi:hypothetical protein
MTLTKHVGKTKAQVNDELFRSGFPHQSCSLKMILYLTAKGAFIDPVFSFFLNEPLFYVNGATGPPLQFSGMNTGVGTG